MLDTSEVRYDWVEIVTKSGRPYLSLNDNPNYVIYLEYKAVAPFFVAGKRTGSCDTVDAMKAMVEGLFDHDSLPKDKRWMTI